jgi:ketosteroid isomerase-like protein
MNPQEIRVGDGWAVIRGAMSGRRANATEESATIVGKFMMIVDRQQDGSWLLSRLIWNDDPEDL